MHSFVRILISNYNKHGTEREFLSSKLKERTKPLQKEFAASKKKENIRTHITLRCNNNDKINYHF